MITKNSTRYIIAGILILIMLIIISSLVLRYHVKPKELYFVSKINLISDYSFENFNQSVEDCCNADSSKSQVYASKSIDAYDGKYSLNLTSKNQCACIDKDIGLIHNNLKYLISIKYKGQSPRICVWANNENNCILSETMLESKNWTSLNKIVDFSEKSIYSRVFLYSDSDGRFTTTNLYDNLQVHELTSLDLSYNCQSSEQYIIKTDPSNMVHNGEALDESGYYLVKGKPEITIRFPWPELILLLFMMLVVIRLLFKKHSLPAKSIENPTSSKVKYIEK